MFISISGKQGSGKSAVAEELRNFFTYRGNACYVYDYLSPLRDLWESIYIVGLQHGLERPLGVQEDVDPSLQGAIYDWSEGLYFLTNAADKHVRDAISRWDELNLIYMAILDGPVKPAHLYPFSPYGVYLQCDTATRERRVGLMSWRGEGHPLEAGFNDCAVSDIFDLVVDTNEPSPKEIADLIGNKFLDKLKSVFK